MPDLRAQLLQRIHDDLDDDLARSVYADHLLGLGGADAWHGELIRLSLDGGDPGRIQAILATRATRELGPLARLFEITWVRGFPERARARRWSDEHVTWLRESRHLPTLRSIEIPCTDPHGVDLMHAAPRALTGRITVVVIEDPCRVEIAQLLESDQFPALRHVGLLRTARMPPRPNTEVQAALLASALASQLTRISLWSARHERERWVSLAPPNLLQLDIYELDETYYTEVAFSYVRDASGALVEVSDPVIPVAAQMGFYRMPEMPEIVESWSRDKLRALEQRLLQDGYDREAAAVRTWL